MQSLVLLLTLKDKVKEMDLNIKCEKNQRCKKIDIFVLWKPEKSVSRS